VVAEATYTPPPVRDLAAPVASPANTVGHSENGTPTAGPITDAQTYDDAGDHSDTTSVIDFGGSHAADVFATPATDAPTGSGPAAGVADPTRTGSNADTDQTSPAEPDGDTTPLPEAPTTIDGTTGEPDSTSEQTHVGVDTDRAEPPETLDIGAEGTGAATNRDILNAVPVVELATEVVLSEPAAGGEQAHLPDLTGTTVDNNLTPAALSSPETTASDSAATSTTVDQSTGGRDIQDSVGTDGVERYRAEDLGAFVAFGTATNHALYEGPDGRWHAVGDEVGPGLHREGTGRLRDARGYVTDDNKLPPKDIDAHAERGQPLDQIPTPTSPDQLADLASLRAATLNRAEKQATKNEVWVNQVEPLIDSLKQAGLTVDRNTFGSANFKDELREAVPNLPRNVRNAVVAAAADYAQASQGLVDASETLGVAGGKFVASLLHPDGQTITSSDGTRGVKGTFDRTIYDGSGTPMLIIIEEKGAGSTLGVSKVDDPNNPGPKIIAQQCSPEYVHHLLQGDDSLAGALQGDPQLYRDVQSTIEGSNGGDVECLLVHTSADGTVSVVPYLLDPSRFRRDTIRIPSNEGTQ